MKLTQKERSLLDSVEKAEWKRIPNFRREAARYSEEARATPRKDKRMNIRMTERDLVRFQKTAVHEGMPCQTLLSSIRHKYINGRRVRKISRLVLAVASTFLIASALAQSQDNGVSIVAIPAGESLKLRLHRGGGLLLTDEVRINGRRIGRLIVDTGAWWTAIEERVIRSLRLESAGKQPGHDGRFVPFFKIDSFELGPFSIRRHKVIGQPSVDFPRCKERPVGLLGADVLGRFPFTVDYQEPSLTLHCGEPFTPPADAVEMPMVLRFYMRNNDVYGDANPHAGVPYTEARINGEHRASFELDTGTSPSVLLPPAFSRRFPHLVGPVTDAEAVGHNFIWYRSRVRRLSVFGADFASPWHATGLLYQTRHWWRESNDNAEVGLLGSWVLRNFRLTFDYEKRRLWAQRVALPDIREQLKTGLDIQSGDLAGVTPLMETACENRTNDLAVLIAAGADPNAKTGNGESVLVHAIKAHSTEAVGLLLKAGAKLDGFDAGQAFRYILLNGNAEMYETLTSHGLRLPADRQILNGLLIAAAGGGNADLVTQLLDRVDDVNCVGDQAQSGIHVAAMFGHEHIVRLLLDRGAQVDVKDRKGLTPLAYAALMGHAGVMRMLIAAGAEPSSVSNDGMRPLDAAAQTGCTEGVDLLIQHGADVNADNVLNGKTPLMCAAWAFDDGAAVSLIAAGAGVNAVDSDGISVVHHACVMGHAEMLKLLIEAGATGGDPVAPEQIRGISAHTPLINASLNGHLEVVRILLRSGVSVNTRSHKGYAALVCAAGAGYADIARELLAHGADPDIRGARHETALMEAARNGDPSLVVALLESGADIDAVDSQGRTPLMYAAARGHSGVVETLLRHGADAVKKDYRSGMDALQIARRAGHAHLVGLLGSH